MHEARVRVALKQGALDVGHAALSLMKVHCQTLGIATLDRLVASLACALYCAEHPEDAVLDAAASPRLLEAPHLFTQARVALSSTPADTQLDVRARRGLQVVMELTSSDAGFIVLPHEAGGGEIDAGRAAPSDALVSWARQQLERAHEEADTELLDAEQPPLDTSLQTAGAFLHRVPILRSRRGTEEVLVGALVLGCGSREPQVPKPEFLMLLADRLQP